MAIENKAKAKVLKVAYDIAKIQFNSGITAEKVLIIYNKLIEKL